MPAIKLEQFGGQLPAWDPHLLPVGQAADSENTYLFSGALEGWREPTLLRAMQNPAARYAYRIPVVSETQANAYLLLTANVLDGDTVTVSELTYTFKTVVALANDVTLGATPTQSLTNLLNALTYDFGQGTNAGVDYGVGTLANDDVLAYPPNVPPQPGLPGPQVGYVAINSQIYPYMQIGSTDFGAAFNTVAVSSTSAGALWLKDLLSLSDTTTTYAGGSNASFNNQITGTSTWLEFLDQDTNVVKSQVVDDSFDRYYAASPSQEPAYNTYDRIVAGKPMWKLGIPAPGCAPLVSVTAGGNSAQYGNLAPSLGVITPVNASLNGNYIYLIPITPKSTGQLLDVQLPYNTSVSNGPYPDYGTEAVLGVLAYFYYGTLPPNITVGQQADGTFISLVTTPGTYANGANNSAIIINSDGSLGAYDGTPYWAGVVYQDNNGAPGDLLALGENVLGLSTVVPNTSVFTNPPTLNAGEQYWVGVMMANPVQLQEATVNATAGVGFANTFTNGPPAVAPVAGSGLVATAVPFSMFADFGSTTDVVEARTYVYTWVSAYDEEGPPSPPTLVNGWSNGTWNIGLFTPPPADMGVARNLAVLRLYRTVVASGGSTVYFWVADISLGSTEPDALALYAENPLVPAQFASSVITSGGVSASGLQSSLAQGINPPTSIYEDIAPDNLVALANQLPSTNWFPPPENLESLITMPNGVMAGFKDNEVWFCEPYLPHAWPAGYVLTTDFPIVGLGVTTGALVICTGATAYVSNGVSPGNMTLIKCSTPEPCMTRASILNGDAAVTYMSPNGLIQVTANGVCTNMSDLWITREKWQVKAPQKYTRAIYLASCYFCFGSTSPSSVTPSDNSVAQQGFTIELDQDNASFSIWPQPGGHRLGFNGLTAPQALNVDNVLLDPWTGTGMLIQGGNLYFYDFSNPTPVLQPYEWMSKIYQMNTKKSLSAMKVFFQVPPGTPALDCTRVECSPDDPIWTTLGPNQYGILKTYADVATEGVPTGTLVLVDCREIRRSGELLRLPSGFKAEQFQWEILGRVVISNIQIASSAKELANI